MGKLEDLKHINYLSEYYAYNIDVSKADILGKISEKIAEDLYKEVCENHGVCHVCGRELTSGKYNIRKRYPDNHLMHAVKSTVCPTDHCQYNMDQSAKLQNEEDSRGILYR